jgi:hypothetical protein
MATAGTNVKIVKKKFGQTIGDKIDGFESNYFNLGSMKHWLLKKNANFFHPKVGENRGKLLIVALAPGVAGKKTGHMHLFRLFYPQTEQLNLVTIVGFIQPRFQEKEFFIFEF